LARRKQIDDILERGGELGMERDLALEIELPVEDCDRTRRACGTGRCEIDDWREKGSIVGREAGSRR
jgi:hypothetical protein